MIWSAVFVHLNGLAFSFQNLIHCSKAQVNSSMEQKDAPVEPTALQFSEPSLDLVQPRGAGGDEVQLEPRVLQQPPLDRRGLVHGKVVADQMDRQVGFDPPVDLVEERGESCAACWAEVFPITMPVAMFSVANRSTVPCRS